MYQCSICGDIVYESQLDHHMLICFDPNDTPSPRSAEAGGAAGAGLLSSSGAGEMGTGMPGSPRVGSPKGGSPRGGSPRGQPPSPGGDSKKTWKQWKDSELAQHHEAQSQRSSERRSKIAEELQRREDEECTFKPKVLHRAQPHSSTRTGSAPGRASPDGEPRHSQRWADRSNRLRRVEAQVYADLTLKPQISRFAQVWSQRQTQERLSEGQQMPNVFDRLYHAALQAQASQQAAHEERVRLDSAPTKDLGQRPHATRRIPTSELLYSDAIDRRERLKVLAEQIQLRTEEVGREKRQVSGRSRRYYWQMLERQIKAAFDAATEGEQLLLRDQLEDFLVRFGCVRARRDPMRGEEQREVGEEEAARLRGALWVHLDPQNSGRTDLLTLTVFFHVLMGAVDEAARASQSLSASSSAAGAGEGTSVLGAGGVAAEPPLQVSAMRQIPVCLPSTDQDGQCPPAGPAAAAAAAAAAAIAASSGAVGPGGLQAGLTAISEEESGCYEEGIASGEDGNLGGALAGNMSMEDHEGKCIVELLQRFEPTRLRSEFQSLYLHRMHYQAQQQQQAQPVTSSSVAERPPEPAPAPEIDSMSRVMAARLAEREKGECDRKLSSHADVLLWRHSQAEAKKQVKRAQARNEEVSGCTFQPKCSPRAHEMQGEVVTPRGVTRAQVLYARAVAERERKEARAQEDARAKSDAEVRDCTFRPDTGKSSHSFQRSLDHGAPLPRGFHETRQRLRNAGEVERQRRQLKEDRLARPVPMCHAPSNASTSTPAGRGGHSGAVGGYPDEQSRGSSSSTPMPAPVGNGRQGREPRGAPPSEGGSVGGVAPASPRGTSQEPSNTRVQRPRSQPPGGSAHEVPAHSERPPLPPGASVRSGSGSPRTADARGGVADATAGEDPASVPLLYVDVNIAPGQPPERIVLREGQSVNEVAAEFATRHVLPPVLAQRLHALLKEVLQRQEQHLSKQHDK